MKKLTVLDKAGIGSLILIITTNPIALSYIQSAVEFGLRKLTSAVMLGFDWVIQNGSMAHLIAVGVIIASVLVRLQTVNNIPTKKSKTTKAGRFMLTGRKS